MTSKHDFEFVQLTQNNDEKEEKQTKGLLHTTAERSFSCKVKKKCLFAGDFIELELNHIQLQIWTTQLY